ncbi:hypothetical protein CLTEP_02530 [Clostridium tepidiprofundi DSM 19306]|uniref:Uncharacterized protein n=1 Tax=Clostridium tepidiprofundi DSM 19306 TaxID=1121338 RepID=A0A151B7U9_9CLOT|nr:hypothetical protein [Clostridium tepidiprofundi]KYH35860.1 hypothetical protein CLTEP_02530 [Clostridium tepidiprofundi DSM 19306]
MEGLNGNKEHDYKLLILSVEKDIDDLTKDIAFHNEITVPVVKYELERISRYITTYKQLIGED